jgi:hypothetical protein
MPRTAVLIGKRSMSSAMVDSRMGSPRSEAIAFSCVRDPRSSGSRAHNDDSQESRFASMQFCSRTIADIWNASIKTHTYSRTSRTKPMYANAVAQPMINSSS